jgi:hypothetical protein
MLEQALDDLGSWLLGWASIVPLKRRVRTLGPLLWTDPGSGMAGTFSLICTSGFRTSSPPIV